MNVNDNNWKKNKKRKNGKRYRPRTPFIKQNLEDIGKSIYKEMEVTVIDRD